MTTNNEPLSPKDQKQLKGNQQSRWQKFRDFCRKFFGLSDKTFWDLLLIAILPLVIGYWGVRLNDTNNALMKTQNGIVIRQNDLAKQQNDLAQQQFLMTLLQECNDKVDDLLIDHGLLSSQPGSPVRLAAYTKVHLTLQQLSGDLRAKLITHLHGLKLIRGEAPIIHLRGAYLKEANFKRAYLEEANFEGTYLDDADLRGADLRGAILQNAKLSGAKYNIKAIQEKDSQGNSVTIEPTQWPQGFDPKAVGAICVDC